MKRRFVVVLAALTVACVGCATTRVCPSADCDFPTVAVRFAPLPESVVYTDSTTFEARPHLGLGIDESGDDEVVYEGWRTTTQSGTEPHHVVLWGGPFDGTDMTYRPASLGPGEYMFGLLEQDRGTAFQGWIHVNNAQNNIVNLLTEWRDTVADQKLWLGYEYELEGKFTSRDADDFKMFQKQLKSIKRLESRINHVIEAEKRDFVRCQAQRAEVLAEAEVLLIPGTTEFFTPSTQPAFTAAELDNIRTGNPMTKVVMVADYPRTTEQLARLNDLRDDLRAYRSVMVEEINRLERRKRFLTVTDHVYHHGKSFVENERRLQETNRGIAWIDQQLDKHRKRAYALAFFAGLFAPDETYNVFDNEQEAMYRDRQVLEQHKRQLDLRFENANEDSWMRVTIERERQNAVAMLSRIDDHMKQVEEARIALNKFRNGTQVIHRHGPARVLATTMFDGDLPGPLVNAIEQESLMTVRLQASDSLFAPPTDGVARTNTSTARTAAWNQ